MSLLPGALGRYVARQLLTRTLGAALALAGLLQVLDLLDATTDILERGLGLAGVLRYSALRLPGLFQQVAALSMLIGALFTFMQLARDNEIVVMRATGSSIYRILGMMLPVGMAVMAVSLLLADQLAPRADAALAAWWRSTTPPAELTGRDAPRPRWFRIGDDLVNASYDGSGGQVRLRDLRIYRRDADRRLVEKLTAPLATPVEGGAQASGWRLQGAVSTRVRPEGATQVSAPADQVWTTGLRAQDVRRLFVNSADVSSGVARRALRGAGLADQSPGWYRTRVQRAFAEPAGVLVMLLLAAPAALGNLRSRDALRLMLFGLSSGLLFLVADGLLTALGEAGALAPWLAAWSAPVAFAALAGAVLLRLEG